MPKPKTTFPYHSVKLSEIKIGERFRKDYGAIDKLAANIKERGLFHPLVIDRDRNLLAGGRRHAAVVSLGWEAVDCHYIDDVDDLTRREIELEENLLRQNLTYQEQARLTEEIDRIGRLKYGDAKSGRNWSGTTDPEVRGWSLDRTAEVRGVDVHTVHRDLAIATALKVLPSLDKETSQTNALRRIRRLEEDIIRELLLRKRAKEVAALASSVIEGDATSLILGIETGSVDCIITDPPYGDANLPFGHPHRLEKEFDDSPETAMALIRSIGPELRRVLKPSGHLYAFFSSKYYNQSLDLWRGAGFDVRNITLVWHKLGGATGTVNWDFDYAPAWEPFLLAHNGERRLAHKRENVFDYAPPLGPKRFHPSQKPVPLIQELLAMSTDPGDLVLDPFAGSGSVAVAATLSKRRFLVFEQLPRYVQIIKQRLIDEVPNAPAGPIDPDAYDPEDMEEALDTDSGDSGESV